MVVKGLVELGREVEVINLTDGSYFQRLARKLSPGLCHRLRSGKFDILIKDELCHRLRGLLAATETIKSSRPCLTFNLLRLVPPILFERPTVSSTTEDWASKFI